MYLEKRAREKELEEQEKAEREKEELKRSGLSSAAQAEAAARKAEEEKEAKAKKKKKKGGLFGSKVQEDEPEQEITEADLFHSPRPAFYAHSRPTRRTQVPRDVAVPYFRFRKERFYDWPPDPTVSRATPLMAQGMTSGRGGSRDANMGLRMESEDRYGGGGRYESEEEDDFYDEEEFDREDDYRREEEEDLQASRRW